MSIRITNNAVIVVCCCVAQRRNSSSASLQTPVYAEFHLTRPGPTWILPSYNRALHAWQTGTAPFGAGSSSHFLITVVLRCLFLYLIACRKVNIYFNCTQIIHPSLTSQNCCALFSSRDIEMSDLSPTQPVTAAPAIAPGKIEIFVSCTYSCCE
jgi:hypothetical protein